MGLAAGGRTGVRGGGVSCICGRGAAALRAANATKKRESAYGALAIALASGIDDWGGESTGGLISGLVATRSPLEQDEEATRFRGSRERERVPAEVQLAPAARRCSDNTELIGGA